ncbi:MAG: hypothetical protein Q8R60_14215 [Mycobacteriales bacterium]|nr:hypothetical protein [Mycobacteriales bacterium]
MAHRRRRGAGAALLPALVATVLASAACADTGPSLTAPSPPARNGVAGLLTDPLSTPTATPTTAAPPAAVARPQLPRGGRQVFPRHLVVMHYGTAGSGVLGVLGEGTPEQAAARVVKAAAPYAKASGRAVLPAFELITTIARRAPGPDGTYSTGIPHADVERYLAAVRKAKGLLVLDFQPGKADLLDQVRRYERFLREPDVGIALDPEWKLTGSRRPGRQIGRLTAAEVNRVSAYLATLRRVNGLPEKLFVLHQFRPSMLPDRDRIALRNGLATVLHVDGFGSQGAKRSAYSLLQQPARFHMGFKLFLDEDTDLMTPVETMALRPRPELVSYQ